MKKLYALAVLMTVFKTASFSREAPTRDEIASGRVVASATEDVVTKQHAGINPSVSLRVNSCDSLATPFNSNNGLNGNMFDVVPLSNVYIAGFDLNCTNSSLFYVYYKTGSYVGFEVDSTVWTFLDTVSVVSNGTDIPSVMMLNNPLQLTTGNTMAIYIFSNVTVRYTDGTAVGNVAASNSAMQILEGEGCSAHWGVSHFHPRVWNGTIFYCDGTVGVQEASAAKVNVYPNPVNDVLHFILPDRFMPATLTIKISDAMGHEVMTVHQNEAADLKINSSQFSAGIYFYSIYSSDGMVTRGKFCKQ